MIVLTPEQLDSIIKTATAQLVERLLLERREDLDLLTPAQVCGILDLNTKTLDKLQIPRVTLIPGKAIRYRMADVKAWIDSRVA